MNNEISKEINRLSFENLLWLIFIGIIILNIYADTIQQRFVIYNNPEDEKKAKEIYVFVLIIVFFIYIYFFIRNYNKVKSVKEANNDPTLYEIRLFGSILLVVGVVLLIYFQVNEKSSVGTPAI